MELTLNLIWLGLAFAGFALLGSDLSRAKERSARQPNNREKIMAMTCALIILFFVVSMTDDLHDQEIFVEESKLLKVVNGTASPALPATHSAVAPPLLLFFGFPRTSFAFSLPTVRRLLEPLEVSFTEAFASRSLCGRAPPVLPA
jgi:hypothetical protein